MPDGDRRTTIHGVFKGVLAVNSDISLLAVEVTWDCNQMNREEVKRDLEQQMNAMPIPDEMKKGLLTAIEQKLLHHKESRVMEIPVAPEVAREFANMVGREVDVPLSFVPTDVENFDRTKTDQRTPVGGAHVM